jgi:hypothetical protein
MYTNLLYYITRDYCYGCEDGDEQEEAETRLLKSAQSQAAIG